MAGTQFNPLPTIRPPPKLLPDLESAYAQLSPSDKDEHHWQYQGYPGLTKWMASANDFFLLRRFSPLQARCLLYLQNEIAKIDKAIEAWDAYAQKHPPASAAGMCGSLDNDPYSERIQLVRQAIPLLEQYNQLVHSFAQLKAKPTARNQQINNLKNWFAFYPHAIDEEEQHHRAKDGDLFPILAKPKVPLVLLMQKSRALRFRFRLSKRSDRIDLPSVTYTSEQGLETCATFSILIVGLCMSFGSIWWLNDVTNNVHRLAIITGSASLFTFWSWLAAGNRPFEILAAFAAYMAVLMIYRQLGS
ncbi:hypothetical protein LTR85_002911 [Meristemomyces frigidus]|nr:hypothetical protein LTR85_002911 [Meristemomyces frigidus]